MINNKSDTIDLLDKIGENNSIDDIYTYAQSFKKLLGHQQDGEFVAPSKVFGHKQSLCKDEECEHGKCSISTTNDK